MLICSFSWSIFEFIIFWNFLMFFMVPEASNGSKLMFFHALVILGPSLIDPGSIWKKSFFHENFQNFVPHEWPSSLKTHMYIHNLVNLRVPRPQATQNAKTKWNLSNSTERMLRKTKNKIEKGSKSGAEDILKIQHPR